MRVIVTRYSVVSLLREGEEPTKSSQSSKRHVWDIQRPFEVFVSYYHYAYDTVSSIKHA